MNARGINRIGRILLMVILFFGLNYYKNFAQDAMRELYFEADYDLIYEAYDEALKKFLRIIKTDTDNCNFNYKVGLCYSNIPGKKKEAIPYLEKAVVRVSEDYKDGVMKEINAPIDAYYYLAKAYHVNNEIDKAIPNYQKYREYVMDDDYELELVDNNIKACNNALRMQTEEADFLIENLGTPINNKYSNFSPTISGDQSTLAYTTQDDDGFKEIFISTKGTDGTWGRPKKITDDIGSLGDCNSSALNNDGTILLVTKNDGFNADIYYTQYLDKYWTKMKKIPGKVNTKFMETSASFSPDGNVLYFASDQKGTLGEMDIFISELSSKGKWQKPYNLGSSINTQFNEESPFLVNNNLLYFSSEGHETMGGLDVFISSKVQGGSWNTPENIGYPINSTDDDINFVPFEDGDYAYFAKALPEGQGLMDIYKYEIFSDMHPRKVSLFGKVNLSKIELDVLTDYDIVIQEKFTNNRVASVYPDDRGHFFQILKTGSYSIVFDVPGYEKKEEDIIIYKGYPDPDYHLTVMLDKIEAVPEPEEEELLAEKVSNNAIEEVMEDIQPVANNTSEAATSYTGTVQYTIQICATRNTPNMDYFGTLDGVKVFAGSDGFHRCVIGQFPDYQSAKQYAQNLKDKGYKDVFISSILRYYGNSFSSGSGGSSNKEYTIQIMALKKPVSIDYFKNINSVKMSYGSDGFSRYTVGSYAGYGEAKGKLPEIQDKGYESAYIRKISGIPNY